MQLKDIGKIDVLKVGHHGSKTSSSDDAFMKAIAPKCAVICCGKDNKYGHPHKETTTTLNKYKMTTYRTDLNGTIIVMSDGKKITVETENKTTEKAASITTNDSTATNATVKKQETSTTQPIATTVYITKTGEKYHKDGCSSLSKSKIAISLSDAKAKEYEPCSKCSK